MNIESDKNFNVQHQEEVSELRGTMLSQAKKEESKRFLCKPSTTKPSLVILDVYTNKTTEVPLFASKEVLKALNELFG